MTRLFLFAMVGAAVLSMAGCARITSQMVEEPRVDQELQGNRGYLVGSAPPASERKRTRQVIRTDIEMPTASELNPWRIKRAAAAEPSAAPSPRTAPMVTLPRAVEPEPAPWEDEEGEEMELPPVESEAPAPSTTTYTVQKGDTLEKIAAKVYGDNKKWRRIYKANQEGMKGPDRIYPGQKLTIPALEETAGRSSDTIK